MNLPSTKKSIRVLFVLLVIIPFSIYGQAEKVKAADESLQNQDYAKALELIEEAVVHPNSKDNPRAWYTRMNVFGTLATNRPLSENKLSRINEVMASYEQVKTLDQSEDKYFTQLADVYFQNFHYQLINKGVTAFQQGAHEQANDWFIKSQTIMPSDTLGYYYAGVNAQSMERMDIMRDNYAKLVELNSNVKAVYSILITLENTETKDPSKALLVARKAIEKFPNDNEFRKQEINTLLLLGRLDKALEGLKTAIENEPNNANLLFNLGYLYERQKNADQTIFYYKAAIEAKPDYFEAVYGLGTFYYNQGVDGLKQLNELSLDEFKANGEKLKQDIDQSFSNALPYFIKSTELKPKEAVLWNTLANIYGRLKMTEKEADALAIYNQLRTN